MSIMRYIFPTLITCGNAFLGFLSICLSFQGDWGTAGVYIFYAAVLDLFDGRVARILKGSHNFGREIDSFADFLSFGIAPAMMFITLVQKISPSLLILSYIIGFIYLFAVSARLAIFNNPSGTYFERVKKNDPSDFVGMPSTFIGGILGLLMGFSGFSDGIFGDYIPDFYLPIRSLGVVLLFATTLLLIPIPFPKIGRMFFAFKEYPKINFTIIVLLICFCRWILLGMSITYILLPIFFFIYSSKK